MTDDLDAAVRAQIATYDVVGAAVGVWVPGQAEFLRGYGVADTGTGAPFDVDLHVRIGSITKSFTATAVLMLVDAAALRLDDRLDGFVKGVPHGGAITVGQLLNMTAGVFSYTDDPECQHVDALEIIRRHAPVFAPGAPGRWQYSNSNYLLLGLIVEQTCGLPVGAFIEREIVDVLQLRSTSYPTGPELPAPAACGYYPLKDGAPRRDASRFDPAIAGASGVMISTVTDLRRWSNAVVGGALLSPESHAVQLTFGEFGYGAGVFDLSGYVGHNGVIDGFGAAMFQHPDSGATIVVVTNTSEPDFAAGTAARLARILDAG